MPDTKVPETSGPALKVPFTKVPAMRLLEAEDSTTLANCGVSVGLPVVGEAAPRGG